MTRGRRRWKLAAFALAAGIVVFGVIPTRETLQAVAGGMENGLTVAGHFFEYAALAFVLPLALRGWDFSGRTLLLAGAACLGLGAGIELLQLALPYRSAQAGDVAVDLVGTALGLGLVSVAGRSVARRSR